MKRAIIFVISAERLDRLGAACARGEDLALLEMHRLFDRIEQQLLRERDLGKATAAPTVRSCRTFSSLPSPAA